jgi:predicted O-methyltransferase YrrM
MASTLGIWLRHRLGLQAALTQLTDAERAALAKHAAGKKRLLEIGVYFGASTGLLRRSMDPAGELAGIDPFFPGRTGVSFQKWAALNEIARHRNGRFRLVQRLSQDAAKDWREPLDFLFIDAVHTWAGVEADWQGFAKWVEPGGIAALHDSFPRPGQPDLDSVRYYAEVVAHDGRFEQIDRVDTLAVLRRKA